MNPFQARYDRCNDVPAITQQATLEQGKFIPVLPRVERDGPVRMTRDLVPVRFQPAFKGTSSMVLAPVTIKVVGATTLMR